MFLAAPCDLLKNGMTAVLNDDGFQIGSTSASGAFKTAEELSLWLLQPANQQAASVFAEQLSEECQRE